MYKCQEILQKKTDELTVRIKEEMQLCLRPLMFRDYLVKLEIINEYRDSLMVFNLYYSPKRNTFRIVVERADDRMIQSYISGLFGGDDVKKTETSVIRKPKSLYTAYTDGSYINGRVGYGAVLLYDGDVLRRFSGKVVGQNKFRQVAGELRAVLEVIRFCDENGIEQVTIIYDYTGVREWAVDAWQAKNSLTQSYKKEIGKAKVEILWKKVSAHSGDYYNDMADELAKKGAQALK